MAIRRRRRSRRRRRRTPGTGLRPVARAVAFGLVVLSALVSELDDEATEPGGRPAPLPVPERRAPAFDSPLRASITPPEADRPHREHVWTWRDSSRARYTGVVRIWDESVGRARANRLDLGSDPETAIPWTRFQPRHLRHVAPAPEAPWAWAYANLVRHDERFAELYAMFEELYARTPVSATRFAEIVIAGVQSLPYTLVHPLSCDDISAFDENCAGYVCQYHANRFQNAVANGRPCVPEAEYGLLSPLEFLYTQDGDCDTRVLCLYTLLGRFGYDVAVLLSLEYQHCVLGIAGPGRGVYKEHRGKRYYVWETVAENWMLGQLSPELRNMNYWHVVLSADSPGQPADAP